MKATSPRLEMKSDYLMHRNKNRFRQNEATEEYVPNRQTG